MSLSPIERMELSRKIRMVLVRHFIDMGRLTISISSHAVRLGGSLARLPGVEHTLTPDLVTAIFTEIRRLDGIRRVDGMFDNWRQVDAFGTAWVPIEQIREKARSGQQAVDQGPSVHEIRGRVDPLK